MNGRGFPIWWQLDQNIEGFLFNCSFVKNLEDRKCWSFLPRYTISFRLINFRSHEYLAAMSKVKSKIRKAKGREEEDGGTAAAANNLDEGKELLCCLPEGQGAVQHNDDVL